MFKVTTLDWKYLQKYFGCFGCVSVIKASQESKPNSSLNLTFNFFHDNICVTLCASLKYIVLVFIL